MQTSLAPVKNGTDLPLPAGLTGSHNQVELGEQLRTAVGAEFDRVATALQQASGQRNAGSQARATLALAILRDKRAEVMSHQAAGYFIRTWQELDGKVRRLITTDPRYQAISASRQEAL